MPFTLDQIVPWGRSYDEYLAMFALSAEDLSGRILGAGDGPASFVAGLTQRGGRVVSIDPLYQFSRREIAQRIREVYPTVMAQAQVNRADHVWTSIPCVEALGAIRMAAMDAFLDDYARRDGRGRYVAAALPDLPFSKGAFDLALCSHLLFLYSDHLSARFHADSLVELCRVARDVRVFPLLDLGGAPSPHLRPTREALADRGYESEVRRVPYEFQKGGNQMLRVFVGP